LIKQTTSITICTGLQPVITSLLVWNDVNKTVTSPQCQKLVTHFIQQFLRNPIGDDTTTKIYQTLAFGLLDYSGFILVTSPNKIGILLHYYLRQRMEAASPTFRSVLSEINRLFSEEKFKKTIANACCIIIEGLFTLNLANTSLTPPAILKPPIKDCSLDLSLAVVQIGLDILQNDFYMFLIQNQDCAMAFMNLVYSFAYKEFLYTIAPLAQTFLRVMTNAFNALLSSATTDVACKQISQFLHYLKDAKYLTVPALPLQAILDVTKIKEEYNQWIQHLVLDLLITYANQNKNNMLEYTVWRPEFIELLDALNESNVSSIHNRVLSVAIITKK